jgi:regulator of cell morphogenesis and NO signaling
VKHSRHEEEIIFPYIRQIESTHRRKETYGNLFVRTLRKPLSNIEKEHEVIYSILKEVQTLTNNYTCPLNGCADQSAIYNKLNEFHNDMLQHTHLEDDILYPKAIEMEKELLQL